MMDYDGGDDDDVLSLLKKVFGDKVAIHKLGSTVQSNGPGPTIEQVAYSLNMVTTFLQAPEMGVGLDLMWEAGDLHDRAIKARNGLLHAHYKALAECLLYLGIVRWGEEWHEQVELSAIKKAVETMEADIKKRRRTN